MCASVCEERETLTEIIDTSHNNKVLDQLLTILKGFYHV